MTTSSTYSFDPKVAEWVDEAFERIKKDPAKLTLRHLRSARRSLSLLFSEWDNRHVKLWAVDEQTQTVTQGTATYNTATGTVTILEMVIRRSSVDTPVYPMSRSEYVAIPTKTTQGLPTKFYQDRARALPTYTLWTVPENSTDQIRYYRLRRLQDPGVPSNTLDVGSRWFEAVASGLAAKLAIKFPAVGVDVDRLERQAENAFLLAKGSERERGDTQFTMG